MSRSLVRFILFLVLLILILMLESIMRVFLIISLALFTSMILFVFLFLICLMVLFYLLIVWFVLFPKDADMISSFETFYPTPSQLRAPLIPTNFGKVEPFNYFANFHFCFNTMQVCVRFTRGLFRVCTRGWVPSRKRSVLPINFGKSWTEISAYRFVDDAVSDFRHFVLELVNMSSSEALTFNDLFLRFKDVL